MEQVDESVINDCIKRVEQVMERAMDDVWRMELEMRFTEMLAPSGVFKEFKRVHLDDTLTRIQRTLLNEQRNLRIAAQLFKDATMNGPPAPSKEHEIPGLDKCRCLPCKLDPQNKTCKFNR